MSLADNPQRANTEQEYNNTRLFDAFELGLGSSFTLDASPRDDLKFFRGVVETEDQKTGCLRCIS